MTFVAERLADSPELYCRMGQPSGVEPDAAGSARFLDLTASGLTRQVANPTLTAGQDDGAIQFDGITGAGDAALDLTGTQIVTVVAEVWWDAFNSTDDRLLWEFSPNYNTNIGGFIVDMNNSTGGAEANTISIGFKTDTTPHRVTIPQSAMGAAGWHEFAVVYDSTNSVIKVYIDGAPVTATVRSSSSAPGPFGNYSLNVMSRNGSSLFAAGRLDELAIYKHEVSAGRLAAHNAARTGVTTTPISAADSAASADASGGVAFTGARDSTSVRHLG